MRCRFLLAAMAAFPLIAGCATTKPDVTATAQTAYVEPASTKTLGADDPVPMSPTRWGARSHGLAGRTLIVSSISDIRLRHKEVVLTFDDGPVPGRTENILATLDRFGVKATFLMVGQMADSHPAIARKVVARGHAIGSHTYRHPNLRGIGFDAAMTEIMKGERAVRKATATEPGFFRFPYLADTSGLRAALGRRGTVVLDVQIDSKDYFKSSPGAITERTMQALARRGSGIILLHDLHGRTATMLPTLLARLTSEGYSVVALKHRRGRLPAEIAAAF